MPPFVARELGKYMSEENGSPYVAIWDRTLFVKMSYTLHVMQISVGLNSY